MHHRTRAFSSGLPNWWRRGVGLLNQWRPDLDCFPKLHPQVPVPIYWRNDCSKHADKHHMGACRRYDPYYTLNGGETWNPVILPGVSSWSGFDFAYYFDTRTVTADRVLPNTFYLYYAGHGYTKPRMAGRRGHKYLADKSQPAPTSMQNFNLFPAKPAISSLPGDAQGTHPD